MKGKYVFSNLNFMLKLVKKVILKERLMEDQYSYSFKNEDWMTKLDKEIRKDILLNNMINTEIICFCLFIRLSLSSMGLKIFYNVDVREFGSGNAGATNTFKF